MSINRVETDLAISLTDPVSGRLSAASSASVQINARNDDGTNGALATVYATPNTGTTLSNPLTTDSAGRIYGWVAQGSYNLNVTLPSGGSSVVSWEAVPAGQVGLNGVTVSGTAANGYILTATGTTTATWSQRSPRVFRSLHTWTIGGAVNTSSGTGDLVNYVLPFFVSTATGETIQAVKIRGVIGTGTSATCKIQKNGADLTGFTGFVISTTAASATPTPQTLVEDDSLTLVVTAVSGSPGNLAFTLVLEHTVS